MSLLQQLLQEDELETLGWKTEEPEKRGQPNRGILEAKSSTPQWKSASSLACGRASS